jgi:hypothetical protein
MRLHTDWRGENTSKFGFHTVLRMHVDSASFHVDPRPRTLLGHLDYFWLGFAPNADFEDKYLDNPGESELRLYIT